MSIYGNTINNGYIYGENVDIIGNVNSGNILSLLNMKITGDVTNNKNISSGNKLILLSDKVLNNGDICIRTFNYWNQT